MWPFLRLFLVRPQSPKGSFLCFPQTPSGFVGVVAGIETRPLPKKNPVNRFGFLGSYSFFLCVSASVERRPHGKERSIFLNISWFSRTMKAILHQNTERWTLSDDKKFWCELYDIFAKGGARTWWCLCKRWLAVEPDSISDIKRS